MLRRALEVSGGSRRSAPLSRSHSRRQQRRSGKNAIGVQQTNLTQDGPQIIRATDPELAVRVETAIWLTEVAPALGKEDRRFLDQIDAASEGANPGLARMALKLATGGGKTTVMAMIIAWQTINAVRRPGSRRFTRGFLVVTPGVTIRDRLRVLQRNDPDSYYASRELVPNDMLRDLERAKIVVTNYHAFLRRETLPLSKGEKPAEEGEERPLEGDDRKEAERNREAARVWISGLEAVRRKLGLQRVIDLSATPFFLRGSGYAEGTLFPWTASDFSLMDAIECGIVKLPRVPVADNIPGGEMPKFRNLWEHIRPKIPKRGRGKAGGLSTTTRRWSCTGGASMHTTGFLCVLPFGIRRDGFMADRLDAQAPVAADRPLVPLIPSGTRRTLRHACQYMHNTDGAMDTKTAQIKRRLTQDDGCCYATAPTMTCTGTRASRASSRCPGIAR